MKLRLRKYLLDFEPLPWRQPLVGISLVLCVVLFGLILFLLFGRLHTAVDGRELIALHYNVYVGVDEVGSFWQVAWIPIITFLAAVLNIGSASWWWKRERTLALFFLIGTVLVEFTMTVATLLIVLVNL